MESSRVHLSWLDCNAVTFKSKLTLDSWSSHEWRIELRIKTRSWWLLIHSRYSILNSQGNHQTGFMAFANVLSHWPSTLDTWLLWKVKALDQVLSNIFLFLKGITWEGFYFIRHYMLITGFMTNGAKIKTCSNCYRLPFEFYHLLHLLDHGVPVHHVGCWKVVGAHSQMDTPLVHLHWPLYCLLWVSL